MNYRLLGKSGLRVSELCLGTMTFGEDWALGPEQVARLDRVSEIELGFPTDFLHRPEIRNFLHGGTSDRIAIR